MIEKKRSEEPRRFGNGTRNTANRRTEKPDEWKLYEKRQHDDRRDGDRRDADGRRDD